MKNKRIYSLLFADGMILDFKFGFYNLIIQDVYVSWTSKSQNNNLRDQKGMTTI